MKDHDVVAKSGDVAKVDVSAPRPHANGCVGCRRAGACISCGSPSTIATGRCLSGACPTCCEIRHTHVDNNPSAIAENL